MKITELTWRQPVVVDSGASLRDAADLMARQGVGALIVVDHDRPIGIVTDRDLVVRGIATGAPSDARVDSLMTMGLIGLDATDELDDLFALFGEQAVRRVPIIDHDRIVGVVSIDDAIVSITSRLANVSKVLTAQIMYPHAGDEAPAPVVI